MNEKRDNSLKANDFLEKKTVFSVIIPVYNVEKYLHQCVDSVLTQNFNRYEIILVNDGSTDNSGKICDEYAQKYPNIKVIHKQNGGLSDARNFGIKEAKGEYVMLLDSDDFWEGEGVMSDLYNIIQEKERPDLIIHGYTIFSSPENKRKIIVDKSRITSNQFKDDSLSLIVSNVYNSTGCWKIVKKELIIKNDLFFEKNILHEDAAWCFDLLLHIQTYELYDSEFYCYRIGRGGSITTNIKSKNILDLIYTVNKKVIIAEKNNKREDLKLYLNGIYRSVFTHYFLIKDENEKKKVTNQVKLLSKKEFNFKNIKVKHKWIYNVLGYFYSSKIIFSVKKYFIRK